MSCRAKLILSASSLLAYLLLSGWAAAPAGADIVIEGTHNQSTTVILDFGVYADYTTRIHKIAAGDTLQKLAKAHLGATSRWKEIAELNPAVKPEKLEVGKDLLLPPAKKPLAAPKAAAQGKPQPREAKAGSKHWWHVLSVPQPHWPLLPFAHGQEVPVAHYGTTVIAVRHDKLEAFKRSMQKAKGGTSTGLREIMKKPPAWFAYAPDVHPGRGSTEDADPVYRIEQRLRITSIDGGRIRTKLVAARYLDRNGKELSAKEIENAGTRRNLILLLLAAVAAVGLIVLVLHRRRAAAPASA